MAFTILSKTRYPFRPKLHALVGWTLVSLCLLLPTTLSLSQIHPNPISLFRTSSEGATKGASPLAASLVSFRPSLALAAERGRRPALRRRSPFPPMRTKRTKQSEAAFWHSNASIILRLIMASVIGYFIFRWRRGKKISPLPKAAPKVEVIKHARTPAPEGALKVNPAGFSMNAVIINESAKVIIPHQPIPPSAKTSLDKVESEELWENMDLLGQDEIGTRSKISATVDRMIGEFHANPDQRDDGNDKIKKKMPFIIRRRAPTLKLPVPLLGHFEGRFGEQLLWHGPFRHRPGGEGSLAVTNQRVIWITERKKLVFAKDLLRSELDRGQVGIPNIVSTDVAYVRAPEILLAATVFVLWYPYGTILSLALVSGYLLFKRPMVQVTTLEGDLHFPLKSEDLRTAANCIEKLLKDKEDQANQPDKKQDQWRQAN